MSTYYRPIIKANFTEGFAPRVFERAKIDQTLGTIIASKVVAR